MKPVNTRTKDEVVAARMNKIRYHDLHGDLVGKTFGHLTVLAQADQVPLPNGDITHNYLCQCDCPAQNLIMVTGKNLYSNRVVDCGCALQRCKELMKEDGIEQRGRFTPERAEWFRTDLISRCTNPYARNYINADGGNIKLCDRWMDDEAGLRNFYEDVAPSYSQNSVIVRIDNTKDFSPDNFMWANPKEAPKIEKMIPDRIDYDGLSLSIYDWAKLLGYKSPHTVHKRCRSYDDWDTESVLFGRLCSARDAERYCIYFVDDDGNPDYDAQRGTIIYHKDRNNMYEGY